MVSLPWFTNSLFRSYHRALEEQPRQPILPEPYATWIPIVMFLVGQMFVVTSTWALGITGTFLGDYFGILMDHKVEGFPFNVLRDPMYIGSSVCFAATALW
jgi:phosphatidylethanolamine N-methyltransferase